jgi:glycosyltransferase involved in cell wall biosynthesis
MTDLCDGVNIFGYVRAESGVGEHTRLLVRAVREAGIPYSVQCFDADTSRQEFPFDDWGHPEPAFPINIVGVNADQLPHWVQHAGGEQLEGRHTIGLWAWEVEELPDEMARSAAFVDEVWANSSFSAEAIRRKVGCPVFPFPLPITAPPTSSLGRRELDLPEGFLFLFCFDYDSVFERKNPIGVVEAFREAFEPGEALLMIKSVNADRHAVEADALRRAAGARADILLRDGYFDHERHAGLMRCCDAYVSLHRAEGFGLTLGEAMALGKPVVATAYSGNLDFMEPDNSFLVPHGFSPVRGGPYPSTCSWAEPDLVAAAAALRTVRYSPADVARRTARCLQTIERDHSPEVRARFVAARCEAVLRERQGASGAPLDLTTEALGPDLDSPSRFPFVVRRARRIVFRLLRNYHLFVQRVVEVLARRLDLQQGAVESLSRRLDSVLGEQSTMAGRARRREIEHELARRDETYRLTARIRALEKRLDSLERVDAPQIEAAASAPPLDPLPQKRVSDPLEPD